MGAINIDNIEFTNSELFKIGDEKGPIQLHRLKDYENDSLMHVLSQKEETVYIIENLKGAAFKRSGDLFNLNNLGYRIKSNVYVSILKNRLNVAITNMPKIPICRAGPTDKTCGCTKISALRYGHYVGNCRDHNKQ